MKQVILSRNQSFSKISDMIDYVEQALDHRESRKEIKSAILLGLEGVSSNSIDSFAKTASKEQLLHLYILDDTLKGHNLNLASSTSSESKDETEPEEDVEAIEEESDEEGEDNKLAQAAEKLTETFSYKSYIIKLSLKTWDSHTGRKKLRFDFMSGSKRANDGWNGAKNTLKSFIQKISIDGAVLGLAKLMEKNKFLEIAVKTIGTFMLPFFLFAAVLFALLRLIRNPLRPLGKVVKDMFEGSALESFLQPDE